MSRLHRAEIVAFLAAGAIAVLASMPCAAAAPDKTEAKPAAAKVAMAGDEHSHAAHDSHDHGHHEHTVHGAKPKGLLGPGTEFLYVSPQLFFWTLIVFLPCWLILKKVAWEPYLQSLQDREHKIAESLRLAEEAKGDAKRLIEEQDAFKAKAFASIRETIDQMKIAADEESERILAEAKSKAAQDLEAAKAEIEDARQQAISELRKMSSSLAAEMAGKLASRRFESSRFDSVIEEIGS